MAGIQQMAAVALQSLNAERSLRQERQQDWSSFSDTDQESATERPAEALYRSTTRMFRPSNGFPRETDKYVFQRLLSAETFQEHIFSAYPGVPLALTGFQLAKALKSRKLVRIQFKSIVDLKKNIGKGKLFIVPNRKITGSVDFRTPTRNEIEEEIKTASTPRASTSTHEPAVLPETSVTARNSSASVSWEPEATSTPSMAVSSSSTTSQINTTVVPPIATISNVPETVSSTSSPTRVSSGLPRISRNRRRRAQRLAVQRISRWCNRRTPITESPIIIGDDSEETDPGLSATPPEPQTTAQVQQSGATIAASITGAVINNLGLSISQVRQQQDEEYNRSLRADQERDRLRQAEQIQEERRLQQEKEETEALEKLRNERSQNLTAEPENGFVLKIRGGAQRKFNESDSIETLLNFVGSQPAASRNFVIKVTGIEQKLDSWMTHMTLGQLGIRQSSVMEILWDAEMPEPTSPTRPLAYEDLFTYADSSDEDETIEVDRSSPVSNEALVEVLLQWRFATLQDAVNDDYQQIRVARRAESLWQHSLKCFQRGSFDLKKVLKVEFRNESGADEGGLRREYFEILQKQMLQSNLMEETAQGYEVSNNMVAVIEGKFLTLGKMVASMLLQGGPVQPVLSHLMLLYGTGGLASSTIEEVPEEGKKLIRKIETEDINAISMDEAVLDAMTLAGMTVRLTETNRETVVKSLTVFSSRMKTKQPMLEQFWEGAELLGLRTLLKTYPDLIEPIFCSKCGQMPILTADGLVAILNVDAHSEPNSNQRLLSEEVTQNFESYIYDCEDGKCGHLTVGDILKFVTGSTTLPPGGLGKQINIHFCMEKRFPSVSTCTLDMTLPLHLTGYEEFKTTMTEAIVSGPGFGLI